MLIFFYLFKTVLEGICCLRYTLHITEQVITVESLSLLLLLFLALFGSGFVFIGLRRASE